MSFVLLLCLAQSADALVAEGMALQREKRSAEAASRYREALRLDPDHVSAHWELGWSHWVLGDWEKVVEHWGRVEALDPAHPELARYLGTARDNLRLAKRLAEAPPPPPASAPAEGRVRIAAVGDVMMGTDFPHPTSYLPPNDGADLLSDLREHLRAADLTFVNLEGPVADCCETTKCKPGAPPGSCFAFRTPTRYLRHLTDAGVDVVSVANNHAMDFGPEGRDATMKALDAASIRYSGPPGVVATLLHDGLRVGVVAFATAEHSHDLRDIPKAAEVVKLVDRDHDLVVVSFHGGAEGSKQQRVPHEKEVFYGEDRGDLRAFTHAVVDAGADLVLGHGPHVLRGMEVYRGRLIAYSLGNFCTYGRFGLSGPLGTTGILYATLEADGRFAGGRFVSVKQIGEGDPVLDPSGEGLATLRRLSALDFPDTAPVFGDDGALAPR